MHHEGLRKRDVQALVPYDIRSARGHRVASRQSNTAVIPLTDSTVGDDGAICLLRWLKCH